MSLSWLWDALVDTLNNFNLLAQLYRLIFPEPVADATLPPRYITPPDVIPPPEGGQCAKDYGIWLKVNSNAPYVAEQEYYLGTIVGPLGSPSFSSEINRDSTVEQLHTVISFSGTSETKFFSISLLGQRDKYLNPSGQQNNIYNPNGSFYGFVNYSLRYETVDGSPDNCGSAPIPPKDRERSIPVAPPVPVPVPLPPPIVVPPVPVPLPIPPALPLPPGLPRPPLPINPPPLIDVDVNLNFNFYNDIDFNFNININNGNGTLPIEPFQGLAKLIYAVWTEVKDLRKVTDRMAKQIDCLADKFCREGKEIHRLALGKVSYSSRSFFGFLAPKEQKLTPIAIQLMFGQISNAAGRRVRQEAPRLYSPQAIGYYAFQFESGGFGGLEEIRFNQPYIPIPERAIAIAFWLEPQAGEGNLYCWYEKTKYEEQNQPPAVAP